VQHTETAEKAQKYASAALERIAALGLVPTPENYELWYVYHSGAHAEVTRALDILMANNQEITDERCHELHHRFLSDRREADQFRQAGSKMQKTIEDVNAAVTKVKSATSQYNSSLNNAADKMNASMSKSEIEKLLHDVMSDTKSMMQQNQHLEEKLSKSTEAMRELQSDLDAIRKEALTDSLTNLSNRKAFDTEIVRIAKNAHDEKKTFTLILMDIDHFKSFNDNFGHQVGDQVLRLVAKTLVDGVKGRDMAARYGGEEFAIILPDTDMQGAMRVAEILRRAVENKDVVNRNTGEKLGRITMSGGIAEYVYGESVEDLIERADSGLYAAKQGGRNRITPVPTDSQKKKLA
jgi:diguanylate cyclase